MSNHDPFYGVTGIGDTETDFLGSDLIIPRATKKYSGIQYNQKEVSPVSCTIHGAMGAYSDLTGHVFTLDERKSLWDKALLLGADPKVGWEIKAAVDLVKKFTGDVSYYRVSLLSSDFEDAIEKDYSVVAGFRGNADYGKDFKADGVLDLTKLTATNYGHCIRIAKSDDPTMYDIIIDNYKGRDYNVYKVPKDHFKTLVTNRVFFEMGYFYIMNDICPEWAKEARDFVKANDISDGERPNDNLTRAEAWTMLHRAMILKK